MKMLILAAASAAAVGLSACSPLSAVTGAPGKMSNDEALKALGAHLDGCDRHYQGGIGVGAGFTFNIDCKATRTAPSTGATDVTVSPGSLPLLTDENRSNFEAAFPNASPK